MMPDGIRTPGPGCAFVRQQLPALAQERLDEVTAMRVRRHLAECDDCAEALAELVMDDAAQNPESQPVPSVVPPIALYEAFLRMRKTRFGVLWKSVRDALGAADVDVLEWGRSHRDSIGRALAALVHTATPEPGMGQPGAVRVRGAVRTRGAVEQGGSAQGPSITLQAEIVASDSSPTGDTVRVRVTQPPCITSDGRFRFECEVDRVDVDGRIALLTLALPDGEPVTFTAVLARRPGSEVCVARMDEANVAAAAGAIPLDRVTVFVTRS